MTHDEEVYLKLGREVVRMIAELNKTSQGETGYSRRRFTYRGGGVHIFLVNDSELADLLDDAASKKYAVKTVTPPAEIQ